MFASRATLPLLLSLNAGYVDTAGFLALQGLFTAHVTGNFVTLGASLALGTSGVLAKLLALPMFCAVVIATRLLNTVLSNRHWPALELLIALTDIRHRLRHGGSLVQPHRRAVLRGATDRWKPSAHRPPERMVAAGVERTGYRVSDPRLRAARRTSIAEPRR